MLCYPTSDDCDFNLHYLRMLFRVNGVMNIFRTFPCIFLCKIRTHYIVQWIHPISIDQDFKIKISWHYLRILPHRIQLFWPISLNPSCGPPYQKRSWFQQIRMYTALKCFNTRYGHSSRSVSEMNVKIYSEHAYVKVLTTLWPQPAPENQSLNNLQFIVLKISTHFQ